ncbi:unnamed protein product [Staurois parvus]|uniref:Uncharacterized protein n=1 Tax=Staurois parvus TaxID=386267 RepID=A0ABN9D8J9_9NEOB|nr:unnamed protein product [Staurois parvus]
MDCRHSTGMTRDCGHSTGMTRDCGQHRDDQRLWIVQGMTADLWGGGGSGYLNLTDTRSHFRRVVLSSYLFLYPAARCLPGFCNGTRHDSRVPGAQCA